MFALTQEEGRKPGKWRDEDAYSWHHYDPLFKLHCLLVPVLATLFLKATSPARFDKSHFTDAQDQGDQVTCLRSQRHCGLGGNFQQVRSKAPVLSPMYSHIASCN